MPVVKRHSRSEALDVLEQHISTARHPVSAVAWRSFETLYIRRPGSYPRY